MSESTKVQAFVHKLEEGGWAGIVRTALMVTAVLAVAIFLLGWKFRGLSAPTAMDQAQIAREIARGHGFSTKFIRPRAYQQFMDNKKAFPEGPIPDTYHAPLNPLVNALPLRLVARTWDMPLDKLVYLSDRVIAGVAILFFALAALVTYFTLRRLFDHKLAVLSVGLMLLCATFWNHALAGLPQMLMLFLFSCVLYAMTRAVENHYEERPVLGWLALTAFLFGLLALTHALTVWIFLGALVFCVALFRGRVANAVAMVAIFLVMVVPWMVRTYAVSGNPFGSAIYSLLFQVTGELSGVMRSTSTDLMDASPRFLRGKMQNQALAQLTSIYAHLGQVLAAPVFFIALLHLFKRRETAIFRWGVLLMLAGAIVGMSLFGLGANGEQANDLWVLFIPIFTAYGLAFLLVLWNRLNLNVQLARVVFIVLIFVVSSVPMLPLLLGGGLPVHWPPYVPPFIAILNDWFGEREAIASDVPWAVAWYADRPSIWLPKAPKDLIELNDYDRLHRPIAGVYLTPVSGNAPFFSAIVKGEWKDWVGFIMRAPIPPDFPLQAVTALPIDNECTLYADRPRWQQ